MVWRTTCRTTWFLVAGLSSLAHGAEQPGDIASTRCVWEGSVQGLARTDPAWLGSLLAPLRHHVLPCAELKEGLEKALIDTGLFYHVQFRDTAGQLSVEVQEKWTLIPVLRTLAAGSTRMWVLGGYEANLLGRGMTFGGEMQRIGNAPPGGLLFWNARLDSNRVVNLQARDEIHLPAIYNAAGEMTGHETLRRRQLRVRLGWVLPSVTVGPLWVMEQSAASLDQLGVWQHRIGVDAKAGNLTSEAASPAGWLLRPEVTWELRRGSWRSAQLRLYHFTSLVPSGWTTALYLAAQASAKVTPPLVLGGFAEVRGFPDGWDRSRGFVNGSAESRSPLMALLPGLTLGGVAFVDAARNISRPSEGVAPPGRMLGAGCGLRLAVPQVKRLQVRLDLAWPLGAHGVLPPYQLSFGMNSFFQPSTPVTSN